MLNKKKGSHIGFVLSFIIFILSITYIYSILKPVAITSLKETYYFENLKENLISHSSEKVTTFTIIVDNNKKKNRIKLNEIINKINNSEFIIKDQNELVYNYSISGQNIFIYIENQAKFLLKFSYSNALGNSQGNTGTGSVTVKDYSIKRIQSNIYFHEEIIRNILKKYDQNYDNLKKELNISKEIEFDLKFLLNNNSLIKTEKNILHSKNIYVRTIPIEYIDNQANIKIGYLEISIWQ
jgi:hypothetical protein